MTQQVDELVKAANSIEFLVWKHLGIIGEAYAKLTNAQNATEGNTALKELRAATTDLERAVREILYRWQVPDALILNVNDTALRVWTFDALSGLWMNAHQFYLRFLHCKKEFKTQNLTSFFYLINDMKQCLEHVTAESYRWEMK